jgi:hypothetical protein
MRTLAFDGRMGASGDMILAALLAAGADRAALAPVEDALDVRYEVGETVKNGIAATTVDVLLTGTDDASDGHGHDGETGRDEHTHDHSHDEHGHSHDHDYTHDEHGHSHDHDHTYDEHGHSHDHDQHAEGAGPHRTYPEVIDVLESMGLPSAVERDATAIFRVLGEAEAAVHDTDLEETHFHEVGADDAIADVVGACLLLADLDVERVVTTPVAVGGGVAEMAHGTYPVPPPAVTRILERATWQMKGGPVEAELLTPTGAAILAHVAEGVESLPSLSVERSGYGAGGYDFPSHPNVLRVLVGDGRGALTRDEITVLETNLDDAPPEVLGDLQESLAAVGARDVTVVPATMKKSRPGHVVKVVVKPADAERVARRLAVETGSLGIREHGVGHRWIAQRRVETVSVDVDGDARDVDVKVASDDDGTVFDVSAEYDDAAAVARETGLPVRDVMRRAETAYRERAE